MAAKKRKQSTTAPAEQPPAPAPAAAGAPPKRVACNAEGYRIGQSHQNCTIPEAVVVRWRDLYDDGHGLTPTEIARREGASVNTVKKVVYCVRRGQVADPEKWRSE